MFKVVYSVDMELVGPVLTAATGAGAFGTDATMARRGGKYCIPGTLVRGCLRQAWNELAEVAPGFISPNEINDLLGESSDAATRGTQYEPARKMLAFGDFLTDATTRTTRIRIQRDPLTESVKQGAFQVIDSPFKPGEPAIFKGKIRFLTNDDAKVEKVRKQLAAGLNWIHSMGAEKTIGFGVVKTASVKSMKTATGTTATHSPALDGSGHIALRMAIDEPFCVASRKTRDNIFESTEFIPGTALKGAFANLWAAAIGKPSGTQFIAGTDPDRPELSESFDKVRFLHAFPSEAAQDVRTRRLTSIPLSVVKESGKDRTTYRDAARDSGFPGDISTAPAFKVDWKDDDFGRVCTGLHMPEVKTELRVRTAIDEKRRKAKDEQLFAYQARIPDGLEWITDVDFGLIDGDDKRKAAFAQFLSLIQDTELNIGKTSAPAKLTPVEGACRASEPAGIAIGRPQVVVLQTPAILCDPHKLVNAEKAVDARGQLLDAYQEVFETLGGNGLRLERFFAAQELHGGTYIYNRFMDTAKPYEPFLLTSAGSVFVLTPTNDEGCKAIRSWLEHGLPMPEWATDRYSRNIGGNSLNGDHWLCCPFIRENGYGEVAVNEEVPTIIRNASEGRHE